MVHVGNAKELVSTLQEIATKVGKRFVLDSTPIAMGDKLGGPDPDAWFDVRINGITKLNCFITVPRKTYDLLKKAPWAPSSGKRVIKERENRGGKWTKGADGVVIANGAARDAALEILGHLGGTSLEGEHFEAALYENFLYDPPLCNLELKLVSDKTTPQGWAEEVLSINAHIQSE